MFNITPKHLPCHKGGSQLNDDNMVRGEKDANLLDKKQTPIYRMK